MKSLPSNLSNLINCYSFSYEGNEIINIPPNVIRWINRQTNIINICNDTQNVHNHDIQESFKKSLYNLLNDKLEDFNLEEILNNNILTEKTKQLLTEYIEDKSVHSVIEVTFEEVFKLVWNRICKHNNKNDLLEILNKEINDSNCKCFTGRLTRLVNVLVGYYDDININLSDNQYIGNIISNIIKNYKENDINELKEIIRKELLERGYINIEEWLEHVEL